MNINIPNAYNSGLQRTVSCNSNSADADVCDFGSAEDFVLMSFVVSVCKFTIDLLTWGIHAYTNTIYLCVSTGVIIYDFIQSLGSLKWRTSMCNPMVTTFLQLFCDSDASKNHFVLSEHWVSLV